MLVRKQIADHEEREYVIKTKSRNYLLNYNIRARGRDIQCERIFNNRHHGRKFIVLFFHKKS